MSWSRYALIMVPLVLAMLVYRAGPYVLLRGRALSSRVQGVLDVIPAAAFAALVANDLFGQANVYTIGIALVTFAVAWWRRSMILSVCVGTALYIVCLALSLI